MPLVLQKKFLYIFHMKKVYILAILGLMGQSSWAQIRDFQTTRLNSTAGAGVASILSTEAAILNPAASAFFDGSSMSYQSYSTSLQKESSLRKDENDDFAKHNRSTGYFIADHSGPLKGGVAFTQQDENHYERQRMIIHAAAPMGAKASMGVSYNYIQDKLPRSFSNRHRVNHAFSVGSSYIVDTKTVLGLVVVDPTRTLPGEERAIAGFQYTVADRFILIGDVGAQYSEDVMKKYLWRAAAQINIFSDFFLRGGRFYDNVRETKGTGWGASWIGPRLGIEFAQLITEHFGENGYLYQDEKLVDTSLSLLIKF